jgi:hypothetical protein
LSQKELQRVSVVKAGLALEAERDLLMHHSSHRFDWLQAKRVNQIAAGCDLAVVVFVRKTRPLELR